MKKLFVVTILSLLSVVFGARLAACAVWYVQTVGSDTNGGQSWQSSFRTIQHAIDVAKNGDEIWVGRGTFNLWSTLRVNKEVDLYGGFYGNESQGNPRYWETVIKRAVGSSDFGCIRFDSNSTIDRFTITNGKAVGGGGIYCPSYTSPTIRNCIFLKNSADKGGAIYCRYMSQPEIINCIFSENVAYDSGGAIFNEDSSSPRIRQCTFTSNDSAYWGGAISNESAIATIAGCTFSANEAMHGGAIWNHEAGNIYLVEGLITNCKFNGNFANSGYGGAIVNDRSDYRITNCVFIDNYSDEGGGAIGNTDYSHPSITNCTFHRNFSDRVGGAIYNSDSDSKISNCILWDNDAAAASEIYNLNSSTEVTYCNIQGSYTGIGNINADPLFISSSDVHLRIGSPCIDAGDNSAVTDLTVDIDNDRRIIDGDGDGIARVDMGADERLAGAANKIMPLGDSITQGITSGVADEEFQVSYRKALYDKLKAAGYVVNDEIFVGTLFSGESVADFDPDHEGHPGWRANQIVAGRPGSGEGKLSDWLIAEEPNIVLLHIGTNDISGENEDWNEVEDILVVIDDYEFTTGKSVWVVLSLIIDRSCDPPWDSTCLTKSLDTTNFNNNVRDFVFFPRQAGGDNIVLVDMQNDAGIDYRRWYMGGDMYDDAHPFETGYAKMADLWFSALMDILRPCHLPLGHLDYCRDCGPCSAGQGDCDNNSECQGNLTCPQVSGTDICQSSGCPHPVGHNDYCRDCGPCAEGEGDCDNNSECQGALTCPQVSGTDTCQSAPPVCPHPVGHNDYCRDCGPCAEGQGDCDNNSECQGALTCPQVSGTDTCQSVPPVCPHPVGHNDYCRDCGPCAEGQGDCDNNSECQGALTCPQVSGTDTCQSVPPACPHPVGHNDYCRDCGPCAEGQGDCDNNSECQGALTCPQVSGTDTCQSVPPACPHPVGHNDYCRDCGPCAAGQGDCDNNSECQGALTCPQVLGTDTCQASGCPHPVGHNDYCRDCGPCAAGQGDCDNNSECQGALTCPQVSGTDTCQ